MARHRRIYYQVGYWISLVFVTGIIFFEVIRPTPNGANILWWLIAPVVIAFILAALAMGILVKGHVKEVGGNLLIWYEVLFLKKEINKRIIPIKSIKAFAIGEGKVPGGFIKLKNSKNRSYDLRLVYPVFDDFSELAKMLETTHDVPILKEGPYYISGPEKAKRLQK